jgi:hypothetical protein
MVVKKIDEYCIAMGQSKQRPETTGLLSDENRLVKIVGG